MMDVTKKLSENQEVDIFVKLNVEALNWEEAVKKLAEPLYEKGYVKETYLNALVNREKKYPTGLCLKGSTNAALPHADIEHVNKPALVVGILNRPVKFKRMDNPNEDVSVEIIFMPALDKPHTYVKFLKRLATMLQDSEFLERLKSARSTSSMANILRRELKKENSSQ